MKLKAAALFCVLFISSVPLLISQTMNVMVMDSKLNKEVMIGYCDKSGLEKGVFGTYFTSQYEMYEPNASYIVKLTEKINKAKITVVFATWCSDSRIQLGRFYKILDLTGYNQKNLTLIGVNRDKNPLSVNIEALRIERVPTFIVYYDEKEIGRIIETPKKSLEEDLWKIVKKVP